MFDERTGDYIVTFVEVGEGRGDYRRAGISTRGAPYFEFAGADSGAYRVGKTLPLPASSNLYTARLERPAGALTFDGEWNVSEYDANTLSPLDDADNNGFILLWKVSYSCCPRRNRVEDEKTDLDEADGDFRPFSQLAFRPSIARLRVRASSEADQHEQKE